MSIAYIFGLFAWTRLHDSFFGTAPLDPVTLGLTLFGSFFDDTFFDLLVLVLVLFDLTRFDLFSMGDIYSKIDIDCTKHN